MARTNIKENFSAPTTAPGAPAAIISKEQQLRRSVLACLLWEDNFYESGVEIGDRIAKLADEVPVETVIALAKEARHEQHLRHVPLLLLLSVIKRGKGRMVSDAIADVISRADEMAELVALYRKDDARRPLSAQLKQGIAKAMAKFDAYSLGKYNRAGPITLKTLLNTCRPKPETVERSALYKSILDGNLASPETWEVMLSGGTNKQKAFTHLLNEGKLGYLALLRNLRGMDAAGVDRKLVREAITARKNGADKVLPFRFVAAAKAAPAFADALDAAMVANLTNLPKLAGRTVVIVDISGSMGAALSGKSDMSRLTAACALAAILKEIGEDVAVYATAGNDFGRKHATALVEGEHRGMALVQAIQAMNRKLGGGGIFLKQVMDFVHAAEGDVDRVVVITDEQDCARDPADNPSNAKLIGKRNYMLNVASHKNGIGYKKWLHIDGFSEAVVRFIHEHERQVAS